MGESDKSTGILYIATGERFIDEAVVSAKSLKNFHDIHITLLTDEEYKHDIFDNVRILKSPRYDQGDSLPRYDQLPYERTLLLDTDTYICSPIDDLFSFLDYFDIGCALNVGTETDYADFSQSEELKLPEVPNTFPEYNTGVLLFRKSDPLKRFLSRWRRIYECQTESTRNQLSFRQALYDSDLKMFTLPRQYNYRLPKLAAIYDEVKIIHGRHTVPYEEVERQLNKTHDIRVVDKTDWPIGITTRKDVSLRYRLEHNLRAHGLSGSLKKAGRKLLHHLQDNR